MYIGTRWAYALVIRILRYCICLRFQLLGLWIPWCGNVSYLIGHKLTNNLMIYCICLRFQLLGLWIPWCGNVSYLIGQSTKCLSNYWANLSCLHVVACHCKSMHACSQRTVQKYTVQCGNRYRILAINYSRVPCIICIAHYTISTVDMIWHQEVPL